MPLRNLRSVFVAVMLVLVAGGIAATQVFAHSRPLRFDPAPGAVLQASPASVTG
jgi:methionine-rich copper-binding protein CopC